MTPFPRKTSAGFVAIEPAAGAPLAVLVVPLGFITYHSPSGAGFRREAGREVGAHEYLRAEKGDPKVGLGIYAMALSALGFSRLLGALIAVSRDDTGLLLDEERLPKRVRIKKAPGVRPGPPSRRPDADQVVSRMARSVCVQEIPKEI